MQMADPIDGDLPDLLTYGEEVGRKGLAELGLYVAGILIDAGHREVHVYVLQFHRGERAVSSSSQQGKRYQRAVSALDV